MLTLALLINQANKSLFCHPIKKYPISTIPNFHCDRHLLSSIKRTSILKSSLNADELCQEIELFSRSQVSTTARLKLILRELNVCDNLQDQEFWHQQNPKYERQFPNKNPHRILPVDDKSVVVMIRYTTNIEAAAATK